MYIKQVIIQGFRSYRDQTIIEPFSPGHNVIVGRNGSGKSNFFFAIQFVLSDEFSHLRPEQRQQLLHEGTGNRVISAFVEIIFDNRDNRIPIDKSEVYLRRVIGTKKDQYLLDKRLVTKQEVMSLLETAGFSKSNPYYIVKQGKINQMATAPDSQRLNLLKEVAGTRIYDERKEESEKLLVETDGRRSKIAGVLADMGQRLTTLETEKEELKEYQKWDKERRCIEYKLLDREFKEIKRKIEELESRRNDSGQQNKELTARLEELTDAEVEVKRKLSALRVKIQAYADEKETLGLEQVNLLKVKAQLELQIADLDSEVQGDDSSKKRGKEEMIKLKQRISEARNTLDQILPKYKRCKAKEEELQQDLSMGEQRKTELYAKQGRQNEFNSRDERDNWIKKELRKLHKEIKDKDEQVRRLHEDLSADRGKLNQLTVSIDGAQEEVEVNRRIVETCAQAQGELRKAKDRIQNERNAVWREESGIQQTIASLKDELRKCEHSLRSVVGKSVLNGIDSVNTVMGRMRREGRDERVLNGYFGLVIENMGCEKVYHTAVEVTAGSRLFYHIVDSDETGTQVLGEMNYSKLPGEVTFLPLNRLEARRGRFPENSNAVPMIEKVEYEGRFEKAMVHLFGRTLICR